MISKKIATSFLISIFCIALIGGCTTKTKEPNVQNNIINTNSDIGAANTGSQVNKDTDLKRTLPNIASKYCQEHGATMEVVTINGVEDANCVFDDGLRCLQWNFFHGKCGMNRQQ